MATKKTFAGSVCSSSTEFNVGDKVVYPTFVNLGNEAPLEGNETLFVLKFKAKRAVKFNLLLQHGLLVDKYLNTIAF